MNNPNTLLDEAVRACFDVVMQNMTTDQIIMEAVKYSKLGESLQCVKKPTSCKKAYKLLSMLIKTKELESIKQGESEAYAKAIQADLKG